MFEEEYDEDNPRFRDEFGCVNDLLTGESYICGNSAMIGERDALDTAIELCELLNGLYNENKKLKYSNKILRLNKKSCEKGREYERENFNRFDESRVKRIRFLENRLKENGLSIYENK